MPCPSSGYSGGRQSNHDWRNYIESVDITVESYWTPTSLQELVYILQGAEDAGKHVLPGEGSRIMW